ncbi:flagellar motor switch protein FliG [Notoacmeibacter marinus]|uniref:Flagellar motor switch protein FliG n=1 Tax=Notoacmeibacter marinus TaxID=1876515 RepID=A0A231V2W1_9HYPH|nr:FliG C-terminal domain-containing protein [Notoacmeibacter marinus]OXT02480.1 flagellar motor switch protein FliG [Notoacmeibacter marinus]
MIQMIDTHRAIAVIMAMGKERGKEFIRNFQPDELRHMAGCARTMSRLTEDDLSQVVNDFENAFVSGAGLDELDAKVAEMLADSFGEDGLDDLLNGGADNDNSSIWSHLSKVDPEALSEFLGEESELVTAYVLSRLPDQLVARLLLTLERQKRSEVIGFMIAAKPPNDAVVALIEARLEETFGGDESEDGDRAGAVAAALNEFDREELDELLDDLKAIVAPKRLAAVRSKLFRFDDVARLDETALATIFDSMDQELLTLALKGAGDEVKECVLTAVGQRNRRMIEAELASPRPIRDADIGAARRKIVAEILRRAHDGEFSLPADQTA